MGLWKVFPVDFEVQVIHTVVIYEYGPKTVTLPKGGKGVLHGGKPLLNMGPRELFSCQVFWYGLSYKVFM